MNNLNNFFVKRKEITRYLLDNGYVIEGFSSIGISNIFNFMYSFSNIPEHQPKLKTEINKFMESQGFITRKNMIEFNIGFKSNDIDVSLNILKKYKKYFEYTWREETNIKGSAIDENEEYKYNLISKRNDLIIVDEYSTDNYQSIFINALSDIFINGSDEEVKDLFEIIS